MSLARGCDRHSDTTQHALRCDDHEDREETDASVVVSTVGVRGGEREHCLGAGEHVGVVHETDPR